METPDLKVVRVLLGVPNEGHTLVDAYDNRLIFYNHCGMLEVLSKLQVAVKDLTGSVDYEGKLFQYERGTAFEFGFGMVGNVLTPIARERIAEVALEQEMDYLLFIDDDMICPPDIFEQLYSRNKDIVGALAFTRFPPHKPVLYTMETGFDPVVKKEYYTNKSWLTYPKDQLVECDAVGFGAVLIKVDVLRNMPRPWFTAASGKGEDIQFCHDAKRNGYKVYMDTACKLGHLGPPKNVTEEVYESETNVRELREKEEDRNIKLNGKKYE